MAVLKQILVVEDNPINRALLCGILADQYTVLEAENGQEALDILKTHRDDISLILLDIVMPVMDGYTFLSIAKADPAYSSIPIIVTTQNDSDSDEVNALAHGATDFVAKPYKPLVILHRVASIINLRETAAVINQFQFDRLTGLYSREFFYQRVKTVLQQNPDKEYDIVSSDIENFKLINDVFGVPAGDRLLCRMADLCAQHTEGRGICGRINADQYACMMERPQGYDESLFSGIIAEINEGGTLKNVVVKWGIYPIQDRNQPVERMCDRALLACKSIKGQYGKHFARYDDALRAALLREQSITDSMEQALAQEQFLIYLQPKYSLSDETLAGAEALVRWDHPEWGLLSPGEFVPLFEKNGFITTLDRYVWDKTCALLRRMEDEGLPPVPISVNVSRADVYHADLEGILLDTVEKYDVPPARLHLELTESAYTEDPDQIIRTVTRLRELGFVVEMDDFGSGYSSLNMLNELPLDILKLDMKFVRSETAKPVGQGILRFIMGLARWMDLRVVAEGVENIGQMEHLRELGCDYGQGYYFARPMPYEDFAALVQRPRAQKGEAIQKTPEGHAQLLLVADEDPDYRAHVRETFGADYEIMEAEDGESALSCVVTYAHRISAIILSLTLDGADGFILLEELRQEKAIWRIPIIATGPVSTNLEERAMELGADDYAAKPHAQKVLWWRAMHAMGVVLSKERERVLQDEACRDYLSGLLNRRGLSAAADAITQADVPLAVYLFDLDNLKEINDNLGHGEGDRMIRRFGEILALHTRSTDVLARYGGDEFVVIMKQMADPQVAARKGEEICDAFREANFGPLGHTGCSAGVVLCDQVELSLGTLIARADEALYRAKSGHKGGCCLWKG